MNVKHLRRAALVLFVTPFAATACAGGPPSGPGGPGNGPPGGPGGPGGMAAPLFISPFGEPFQGQPGAAWPVAEWFAGADHDGDGALVFAEFEADGRRWFAHLDRNGDGRLDPAELSDYETSLAALRGPGRMGFPGGEEGGQGGPSGGPGGQGGRPPRGGGEGPRLNADEGAEAAAEPPQSRLPGGDGQQGPRGRRGEGQRSYGRIAEAGFFNLPQPVRAADANLDQTVTPEEWAQATQRWFMSLDADRDGRLTLDTLPQTPLQQRGAGRPDQGRGRPPQGQP